MFFGKRMFLSILIICAILFFGWLYFSQRGRDIELLHNASVNLELIESNLAESNLAESNLAESNLAESNLAESKSTPKLQGPDSPTTDFIPSQTFAGERRGYVFKMDMKGTGYYADNYNTMNSYRVEGYRQESRGNKRHISFSEDETLLYSPAETPIETGDRNRNRTKI